MKKIAVFASGNGSNFEVIVNACNNDYLNAQVVLLVCDKAQAYCIQRAKNHSIKTFCFNPKKYETKDLYEKQIVKILDEHEIDLVCLAGYMRLIGKTLLEKYEGKIINIHPSLLPAFKGAHAIKEAFDYGVKVYGITIHYVDESLDGGKIISQEAFSYLGNDILELEEKIHALEHVLYIKTIKEVLEEKINESFN